MISSLSIAPWRSANFTRFPLPEGRKEPTGRRSVRGRRLQPQAGEVGLPHRHQRRRYRGRCPRRSVDRGRGFGAGQRNRSPQFPKVRMAAERVLAAVKRKHYRVAEFFGSRAGAELMRMDSDMAVSIMLSMIERTGRCTLVVHDSFLVLECDANVLHSLTALVLSQVPMRQQEAIGPSPRIHSGKSSIDRQERDCLQAAQHVQEALHPGEVTAQPPPSTNWSRDPRTQARCKIPDAASDERVSAVRLYS